jgi:hypothetical protein
MSKIQPTAQWMDKNRDFYDCGYKSIIILCGYQKFDKGRSPTKIKTKKSVYLP